MAWPFKLLMFGVRMSDINRSREPQFPGALWWILGGSAGAVLSWLLFDGFLAGVFVTLSLIGAVIGTWLSKQLK